MIVSTPQDLALIDARRGVEMFRKVNTPILGIIENMSMFICPNCGARHDIFGHGGARREAARIGVPFLGEIPLELALRETSDSGQPIVVVATVEPDHRRLPGHRTPCEGSAEIALERASARRDENRLASMRGNIFVIGAP